MTDIGRDTPVYPIAIVRRLTGLTDRQIRYYEQVGLLKPARTAGRRRLFTPAEVDRLLHVKDEMSRGLRTVEIRAQLEQGRGGREMRVPSSARRHLPHYAGGQPASQMEPDVETRREYMARRGMESGTAPGPTWQGRTQPLPEPPARDRDPGRKR